MPPAHALKPSAQTVLIVEDQAMLRFLAMDMIAESGFEVVGAASSDEAMAILARRSDIRLVFSDIDMPGSMDGAAMAELLGAMHRPLGIILTSGRSSERIGRLPSHRFFLPKPYEPDDVARMLRGLAQDMPLAA